MDTQGAIFIDVLNANSREYRCDIGRNGIGSRNEEIIAKNREFLPYFAVTFLKAKTTESSGVDNTKKTCRRAWQTADVDRSPTIEYRRYIGTGSDTRDITAHGKQGAAIAGQTIIRQTTGRGIVEITALRCAARKPVLHIEGRPGTAPGFTLSGANFVVSRKIGGPGNSFADDTQGGIGTIDIGAHRIPDATFETLQNQVVSKLGSFRQIWRLLPTGVHRRAAITGT